MNAVLICGLLPDISTVPQFQWICYLFLCCDFSLPLFTKYELILSCLSNYF